MGIGLFGSELWKPALDKYAEATGLSVQMFDVDGRVVVNSMYPTPLVALFREYGFAPDLFAECARICVSQIAHRPVIAADEFHGLTVIGTSLVLEGEIVGAAVAGYALAEFANLYAVRRWADSSGIPFDRLWGIVRRQSPIPERRLMLHGGLLQVLGDALLRENYRTRQYEDTVIKLQSADAAKDEFLAVLSHELRTPLAAIAGWASVMKKSGSLEDVQRAAGAIERNALLQSRMVDDLLDMSGIAQGRVTLDLEVLELAACIRAALETTAQGMEAKAIHVDFIDADAPLFVDGDAGRLQQVFWNILSNAARFTPAGGSIRVSLRRDAGHAVVAVVDTGKGIAPEFLPFVFEIFRQQEQGMNRAHEGLGIGLSLVKKLTELHKGTVSVASAGAGHGTEVTVRLPLAAEIPALEEAAKPSAEALAGLSVLVVEDMQDAREALQALLQLLGARVWVACDGREALDTMTQGAMPDVVLCDLLMPRMDGFEFIRELDLGASSVHPPVIAVSGLASEASRQRMLEAGFEGHIKKPYDEADIVVAVGAALAHRRELQ